MDHDHRTIQLENLKKKILEWKTKEASRIDQEADELIKKLIIIRDLIISELNSNK
jgi:hypothetical protein